MFLNGNSNILLGVSLQKTSLSCGFGVAVLLRLGIFSPMLLLFHSLLSRFVGRNTLNCVTEISSLSKRGWLITVSKYNAPINVNPVGGGGGSAGKGWGFDKF